MDHVLKILFKRIQTLPLLVTLKKYAENTHQWQNGRPGRHTKFVLQPPLIFLETHSAILVCCAMFAFPFFIVIQLFRRHAWTWTNALS